MPCPLRASVFSATACPTSISITFPRRRPLLPDLFKPLDWGSILGFLFPAPLVRAVGGFAEGVTHAEDWYLRLSSRPARRRVSSVDPRVGCYYRQRAGSASADRSAWVRSQSRPVMQLHDVLRETAAGRDWFGLDLLKVRAGALSGAGEPGNARAAIARGPFAAHQGIADT